jgi:hypothetical protein
VPTHDIVTAIDAVLGADGHFTADALTSSDAMRWSPDAPETPTDTQGQAAQPGDGQAAPIRRWEGLPVPGLRCLTLRVLPEEPSARAGLTILSPTPCGVQSTPLPEAALAPDARFLAVGFDAVSGAVVPAVVYDAVGQILWIDDRYDGRPDDDVEELTHTHAAPEDAARASGAQWLAAALRWRDRYHGHLSAGRTP